MSGFNSSTGEGPLYTTINSNDINTNSNFSGSSLIDTIKIDYSVLGSPHDSCYNPKPNIEFQNQVIENLNHALEQKLRYSLTDYRLSTNSDKFFNLISEFINNNSALTSINEFNNLKLDFEEIKNELKFKLTILEEKFREHLTNHDDMADLKMRVRNFSLFN